VGSQKSIKHMIVSTSSGIVLHNAAGFRQPTLRIQTTWQSEQEVTAELAANTSPSEEDVR
jgi:hypothetical protein